MTQPRPARDERGTTLVMALLFAAVVGTAALTLTNRSRVAAASTLLERGSLAVQAAADGGIDTARARLAVDPTWAGGNFPIGDCTVDVRCASAAVGTWSVVVTAKTRHGHPVQTSVGATLAVADTGGGLPQVLRLSSPGD